jgi:hypothetical protein
MTIKLKELIKMASKMIKEEINCERKRKLVLTLIHLKDLVTTYANCY